MAKSIPIGGGDGDAVVVGGGESPPPPSPPPPSAAGGGMMIDFSLAYAALSRATDGGRRLAVPADHPDALLALGALSDALAASFPPPSTGGTEPNAKRRRLVVGSHQEREEGGEEEEAAADDNVGGGKDDAVDSLGVRQCDRVRSRRKKKTDATEESASKSMRFRVVQDALCNGFLVNA